MRAYAKCFAHINAIILTSIVIRLRADDILFGPVYDGKPWAMAGCFHDRAIRPDEFVKLSYAKIMAIMGSPAK